MLSLQNIATRSVFGVIFTVPFLLAPPLVVSASPFRAFSTPTFERQPLNESLNTSDAWQVVAQNAFVAQDYLNSIAAYGKAVDLAPAGDRPELLEERGWVHYRLGHFERANEDLRKAASLHLQQEQWSKYDNARQMRQFVNAQADRLDSSS